MNIKLFPLSSSHKIIIVVTKDNMNIIIDKFWSQIVKFKWNILTSIRHMRIGPK
jgi:hypothetical protein